jgi:hypothetical protein
MRKAARILSVALFAALLAAPIGAGATSYEDAMTECNYPPMFDLLVMRPLSFSTLLVGTALFIPAAPITLLTTPADIGTVARILVLDPARFTFGRRLGECTAVKTF